MSKSNAEITLNATENESNIKDFIFKYVRFLPIILLCVVVALLLAFLKIRYTTPQYSVLGKLIINKESKMSAGGGGQSLEDMYLFSNNVNLKNEVEILQSRQLAKRVVKRLNLQISYFNKGKVRSSNIYGSSPIKIEIVSLTDSFKSFILDINATKDFFSLGENATKLHYGELFQTSNGKFRLTKDEGKSFGAFGSNLFAIAYQSFESATAGLAGSVKAYQNIDQATIIDLSIETDNTFLGREVINTMMEEYGKMNVEDKREISRVTMQFIDERLDSIGNELGNVEEGILDYREKNNVIDLQEQSRLYYSEFEENKKALILQDVQIGVLDYLLNYLNNPSNRYNLVPTNLGIQEPVLLPLVSQYNNLQLQRNNIAATTGPANRAIEAIERELLKLRDQIQEALKNVRQSYLINLNKLNQQLSRVRSEIKSVPSKAKGLLDIERQQKIKQELYLFLLQKREEAGISAAATVSSSRPLEEAIASTVPIKPNKKNIYIIAFAIGALIPVSVIALLEFLNDKVTHKDEVTRHLQIPIVGEVGHAQEGETLVVHAVSRKVVAEQFRIMRTNMQYLITKKENPVILVTSSVSGEGKSFIATNFGAVMALTGKKTVILEFDIRKPRLLKGLNIKATTGLTNYILGTSTLSEIIIKVQDIPNLSVIGCGPVPPNPSEILLDNQVQQLFKELRKEFDVIVIDTAPVGLVSDGFTLSSYADASLYIVRQGYTLSKQLSAINELYQKKVLPNIGLVINDIKSAGRYTGYYGYGAGNYGGYGYGYGYGGDYFEKQNKGKQNESIMKKIKALFYK